MNFDQPADVGQYTNKNEFKVEDFEIPDLFPAGKKEMDEIVPFKINSSQIPGLHGEVEFTSIPERGSIIINFNFFCTTDNSSKLVADFHNGLRKMVPYGSDDEQIHTYAGSGRRQVQPEFEQKGIGELHFNLLENVLEKISKKYPEWKAEWIEVGTSVPKVAKLLISQKWLDENNLSEYKHTKGGQDLGYLPNEKRGTTKEGVKNLLQHTGGRFTSNTYDFIKTLV